MILLHHKVIFQHIQKTGGTTMHKLFKFSPKVGTIQMPCGMHFCLTDMLEKIPHMDINDYEVLTVKRNPWDRFASLHIDTVRNYELGVVPNPPVNWYNYFAGLQRVDDMVDKLFVDGQLPPNLTMLNFDNLANEFCPWWEKTMGYTLMEFPRLNRKPEQRYTDLRMHMVNDPKFQDEIYRLCRAEIEYFGWELPSY